RHQAAAWWETLEPGGSTQKWGCHEYERGNCWNSTRDRVAPRLWPSRRVAPGPRRLGGCRSWPQRGARRWGRCCHRSRGGPSPLCGCQLMDLGEVRRLAEEAGRVDVLVNNVGGSRYGPTADLDGPGFDAL